MKLSILIGTIKEREKLLGDLRNILCAQLGPKRMHKPINKWGVWFTTIEDGEVEIIDASDNKEISIGFKRQLLLKEATGEYIVFIDDDDMVSENYVRNILSNLGKDAIGFLIECTFNGTGKCMASASSKYKSWAEDQDGFKYVRSIYHKTPVRRELALQCGGFKDMRFGEDHDYSMRIMPLIKSENFINEVMYYYMYKHQEHNAKYGIK